MYQSSDMAGQRTTKGYGACPADLCMIHTLAPPHTMGFFGILRDLTQSYTVLLTEKPRDSVDLLGNMVNHCNRQQLISKVRTSARKAEFDCATVFEQGQRTADSLV